MLEQHFAATFSAARAHEAAAKAEGRARLEQAAAALRHAPARRPRRVASLLRPAMLRRRVCAADSTVVLPAQGEADPGGGATAAATVAATADAVPIGCTSVDA